MSNDDQHGRALVDRRHDSDTTTLQIELWNGHAIMLTAWEDD